METILIDMDDTIAGFTYLMVEKINSSEPEFMDSRGISEYIAPKGGIRTDKAVRSLVSKHSKKVGFFKSLPPIDGAVKAVKDISKKYEVRFCTTPIYTPHCLSEKYIWVKSHFGQDWVNKLVITFDKTLIHGKYLIDDRSIIKGSNKNPTWEQLIYPHDISWENYKEVLCL